MHGWCLYWILWWTPTHAHQWVEANWPDISQMADN
jgi:hypothetical protein